MNFFGLKIFFPVRLAYRSLETNRGRTILTIIGIIIAIAAVIIVMSAGESVKGLVLEELEAFGSDYIQIEIRTPNTKKNSIENAMGIATGIQVTTLKTKDAEAVAKLPNIKNYYSGIMGQGVVSYLNQNKIINLLGVSSGFIEIDRSRVAQGRFFNEIEDAQLARVVVLGSKTAESLFGSQNPLNRKIKIGRQKFKVIGVLAERGGGFGLNFDDFIFLPVKTAQKLVIGVDHVFWITAQVKNSEIQDQTAEKIISLLRLRHNINDPADDDFSVTTMAEAREIIDTIFGGINLLLIAIAAISLIVGGVGIMNIMYVSVAERTFEIGLRKAVGARPAEILWQFLWEAITVTLIGGVIGITLGVAAALIITLAAGQFGYSWNFYLPPESIVLAFGFSAAVGLIFGYYPARKAAQMNPVTAIRYNQ